ncbi:hypothetical protein CAPTEDRAFT_198847 [Capitella teleta]|uniref:Chitin-binding type-2 domain-containing protein n=1 Tax=Capitella teleta TaxID=283909 RepID=R7T417_CAPTE|nr:hypothetical protein CAPTEDRAFT_198847 [Capitella teleta]|eukprot:ELT87471.1 hypothetical protein CAPTEDRAFT_198847 [Capitella teleta]
MKSFFALALVAALSLHEAHAQVDCSELPDGVHGWGCRGYTQCEAGQGTLVECVDPEVFNEDIMDCDNKMTVGPPCGLYRECSHLDDGNYADHHVNCTAFYNCQGGLFFGHIPCNPGTVFNEVLGICDFPANVLPPCGTKGEDLLH